MADATQSSRTGLRCENCGEASGPRFCAYCGQEVTARHGPLREVGREFLSDWLSLDSQLLRSLRALLSPARLSELYLSGKRAPFLRPFRLYLVASVVLFSTLLTLKTPNVAEYEIFIGGQLVGTESESPAEGVEVHVGAKKANVKKNLTFMDTDSWLGRELVQLAGDRVTKLQRMPREQVVETLFDGLRKILPLALVLFVPLLALGLKLLYIRKRGKHYLYLDHLVFAIHFQAALFFALSASWLVARLARLQLPGSMLAVVVVVVAILLIYLPWALRRFYGQSRFWTAVKTVAVLYLYAQTLGLVVNLAGLAAIWGA